MKRFPLKAGVDQGNWGSLFLISILSAFAYIGMEWLFMVTKPSFLDTFSWENKLEAFLSVGSLTGLVVALLIALLYLLIRISPLRKIEIWLIRLVTLLPAGIFAALFLLWIDNFTYTIFKFGIVSTQGIWRGAYALLFLLLFFLCYREIHRLLPGLALRLRGGKSKSILSVVCILIVFMPAGLLLARGQNPVETSILGKSVVKSKPNILLLTSDGVNAENMSLYGYSRDTTPFLKELAQTSLVAENALTNSGKTYGSILSFYTGKNPVTTGVIFTPNILKGTDSYQHLPGLLRSAGYRTIELTTPRYADANTMNLLNGFDDVNGQSNSSAVLLATLSRYFPYHIAYFIYETGNRIADRLRHIFYLRTMENPYSLVVNPYQYISDNNRMNDLVHEIETSKQPVFAHVHFMGTHGPMFATQKAVYSAGHDKPGEWDTDFYDDAILYFDFRMNQLYDILAKDGMLDNTVIIVGSDHGEQWSTDKRVPLLINFPKGEHSGTIQTSVQNIDIAPTILDYMGMEIPTWMEGKSLLQTGSSQRPIFSVESADGVLTEEGWILQEDTLQPPFYQFSAVRLSYCQHWYRLNLSTLQLTQGDLSGYVSPCQEEALPTPRQALTLMAAFFEARGFDASSIRILAGE